jgi:CspA family cold shock protein
MSESSKSYKEVMNCETQSETGEKQLESVIIVDRLVGTVKWFNSRSGYGFITVCDGEYTGKDIFVHYSSIDVANIQYRYLIQGEYVDFTLIKSENSDHEYQATRISGVKGGNIMCESRKFNPENIPSRTSRFPPVKHNNTNHTMNREITAKPILENKSKTGYSHPRIASSTPKTESRTDGDGFTVVRKKNIHKQ